MNQWVVWRIYPLDDPKCRHVPHIDVLKIWFHKDFSDIFRCSLIRKTSQDPLFQKMAALYEHIGDLVALGDADATTKAYQEAGPEKIRHIMFYLRLDPPIQLPLA